MTDDKQPTGSRTEPMSTTERERAADVLRDLGEARAARELGVSRLALLRAVGGYPIRNSVATTIRVNVERLTAR